MISILVVGFTSALVYERYIVYVRTLHKRFDPVQYIKSDKNKRQKGIMK